VEDGCGIEREGSMVVEGEGCEWGVEVGEDEIAPFKVEYEEDGTGAWVQGLKTEGENIVTLLPVAPKKVFVFAKPENVWAP